MAVSLKKIIVQTGNLINMEDQIRSVESTPSDELKHCVKTALNDWSRDEEALAEGIVQVKGERAPLVYHPTGINTTCKIFLSDNVGRYATDAIDTVLANISRERIESVIVAPPDVSDDVTLSDVTELWRSLEEAVQEGKVCRIGIADVSSRLFKQLYEFATVKPSTIQVNLANCCAVPEDLTEFAAVHDVQVLTHSDDADMLDEDLVSSILSRVGVPEAECSVPWLARHRTIHTCFGLIVDKGYTISINCAGNQ